MNEDALLRLETRHRAELARLAEERRRERRQDRRFAVCVALGAALIGSVFNFIVNRLL